MLDENYIVVFFVYEYGLVKVFDDQYLVLGDNCNNSYDFYYWGFVFWEKLFGCVFVCFWFVFWVGLLIDDVE